MSDAEKPTTSVPLACLGSCLNQPVCLVHWNTEANIVPILVHYSLALILRKTRFLIMWGDVRLCRCHSASHICIIPCFSWHICVEDSNNQFMQKVPNWKVQSSWSKIITTCFELKTAAFDYRTGIAIAIIKSHECGVEVWKFVSQYLKHRYERIMLPNVCHYEKCCIHQILHCTLPYHIQRSHDCLFNRIEHSIDFIKK